MRIAINGMGRIGRLLFRRLLQHPSLEVVAINDIMPIDNLFYLLKYDSVYGKIDVELQLVNNIIYCNDKKIEVYQQENPSLLPWKELEVDVVLECAGKFTNKAKASAHLEAGAQKVLLSTTGSDDIPIGIYGFNHHRFSKEELIFSPGGCMTNCSTPILKILSEIGIESAQMHFLHSYTSRQELVDTAHKQFRRGRAATESIIPVEIDLCVSVERLLPELQGKIAALSTRIPVPNGAMGDFTVQLKNPISAKEINQIFEEASQNEWKGVIGYNTEEIVSLDIKANPHSSIIDSTLTSVIGHQLKLIAWFDNEYGFTSRMIDWLLYWKQND